MNGIDFNTHDERITIKITAIDNDSIKSLISVLRTAHQCSLKSIDLCFSQELSGSKIYCPGNDYKARHDWSARGQTLCQFISTSRHLYRAYFEHELSGEVAELALACHSLHPKENSKIAFKGADEPYLFRWGTLALLSDRYGNNRTYNAIMTGDIVNLANDYASARIKESAPGSDMSDCSSGERALIRSVSATAFSSLNNSKAQLNSLEQTLYANNAYKSTYDKISFLPPERITEKLLEKDPAIGMDGYFLGNREPFNSSEHLIKKQKKRGMYHNLKLTSEKIGHHYHGKCIEIGAGGAFFASMLSTIPEVEEAYALDISPEQALRWGPAMWSEFSANESKMHYLIRDMHKLDEFQGEFDFAVFCGSLHHMSDIPEALRCAHDLLKPGGTLLLYCEPLYAATFTPKKVRTGKMPHNIPLMSKALQDANLQPEVVRYRFERGNRIPWLMPLLFNHTPLHYLNGWVRFNKYVMLGHKPK